MSTNKQLVYVELEYDWCPLRYGEGACSAVLGTDSQAKCWNTRATCAVPDDYQRETKVLRFVKPTGYEPLEIDAIPSIRSVSTTAARIRPGEDLGERASIDVEFTDHPYHDRTLDKYWRERITGEAQADGVGYKPEEYGTFWGKFRARNPYFRTRGLRLIMGTLGQSIEEMETRHYVMESIRGPSSDGSFRITAHDVLKLADDDRAQAPVASRGTLARDIETDTTEITITPTGVGDSEYPSSGLATIGNEVVAFTRVGNTFTLTRGQRGTAIEDHSEGDTVQLALEYDSELVSNIIRDLLVTYADVPSQFINLSSWQSEDNEYIGRVFGTLITEPTAVNELIGELCEQVGIVIWWNEIDQQIEYRAIRQPADAPLTLTDERDFVANSIAVREQEKKRVSQVWVYYGQIDPTEKADEARNYRSTYVRVDADAESDEEYAKKKIHKVFARWISRFNRPAAVQMAQRIMSSRRNPPRLFQAKLPWRANDLALGLTYDVMTRVIQGPSGMPQPTRVMITSYERATDQIAFEAEEFLYEDPPDVGLREVIVDADTLNMNLRDAHDNIYIFVSSGDEVVLRVVEGVILGSDSVDRPALDLGNWPSNVKITVIVEGHIQGCGGEGGEGAGTDSGGAQQGLQGGDAVYARYPFDLQISTGGVWSGGGGGGGAGLGDVIDGDDAGGGGGGGAGYLGGTGGTGGNSQNANNGFTGSQGEATSGGGGGAGVNGAGTGGSGGDPGQTGNQSPTSGSAPGGPPGYSIDGMAYVTWDGSGDLRGPTVN